jgi:tetratricopeptide (TPR) repeat protein
MAGASFGQLTKEANDLRREKKYSLAIESYNKALESAKSDNQRLVCLFFIAEVQHSQEQYEKSIEAFQEVIDLSMKQAQINHTRIHTSIIRQANAYKKLQKAEEAIELLNSLIQKDNVNPAMLKAAQKEIQNIVKSNSIETPVIEKVKTPTTSQKNEVINEAPSESDVIPVPKADQKIYI